MALQLAIGILCFDMEIDLSMMTLLFFFRFYFSVNVQF